MGQGASRQIYTRTSGFEKAENCRWQSRPRTHRGPRPRPTPPERECATRPDESMGGPGTFARGEAKALEFRQLEWGDEDVEGRFPAPFG